VKLHMKCSALNVDFDDPSLDFLGSKRPANEGIKERYSRKNHYFIVVGQSFVKTVADRHGHVAAARTPKMNCNEMAGDRLTICEQELL